MTIRTEMHAYFRFDNTDGYHAGDLEALNRAMNVIVEGNEVLFVDNKSAVDHAMEQVLAAYDWGKRGWSLIEAGTPPWPYPPSYHTPKGPMR